MENKKTYLKDEEDKIKDWLNNDKFVIKFIKKFLSDVTDFYWYLISKYRYLSEEFIEKYRDKLYWDWISIEQNLSESFIEKYKDKVDWICISEQQTLSEAFIEKYKDYVDWEYISKYQDLS